MRSWSDDAPLHAQVPAAACSPSEGVAAVVCAHRDLGSTAHQRHLHWCPSVRTSSDKTHLRSE